MDSATTRRILHLLRRSWVQRRQCTVLVSLHQPSDETLSQLDQLVVLQKGRVVLNESRRDLELVLQQPRIDKNKAERDALPQGPAHSMRLSEVMGRVIRHGRLPSFVQRNLALYKQNKTGSNDLLDTSRNQQQNETFASSSSSTIVSTSSPHDSTVHDTTIILPHQQSPQDHKTKNRSALSQVGAMGRRMRLQYGSGWLDLVVTPLVVALMAGLLRLDPYSPKTVTLGAVVFLFVPILLFQIHVLFGAQLWLDHKAELQDGRITVASYHVASLVHSLSIPLVSLTVATVLGFAILNWTTSLILIWNQVVLGQALLVVTVTFGRCLSLWFDGQSGFFRIHLVFLLLNLCFAGILVGPHKAPQQLQWLFAVFPRFWASAGVVLNQYEHNTDHLGEVPSCQSFATCVLQNGNVLAATMGYWPLGSVRLAWMVLTLWVLGLTALEHSLLLQKTTGRRR